MLSPPKTSCLAPPVLPFLTVQVQSLFVVRLNGSRTATRYLVKAEGICKTFNLGPKKVLHKCVGPAVWLLVLILLACKES